MKALINVDLVEALRSIVKFKVDHYQDDIVYDLLSLANAKANDYFCFMARESGTWMFEQKEVYIKGSPANITWKHYENNDVSTYALEITQKDKDKIIGNIYEIDYNKTLEDIKVNEKEIEKVEITFMDESKILLDLDDYEKRKSSIINNYGEVKETKQLIKDYFNFKIHQSQLKSERLKKQRPIKMDDYLQDINREKLRKLGYKKDDLYYISSSDCRDLLEKTNINVYMIKDNQKVKIDSPSHSYEKTIYGIWTEDKKRFDSFDRKKLNRLIKAHVSEEKKREKLSSFGYKNNDVYLLDNNREIKNVFYQNIPLYAINKDLIKIPLKNMAEVIENLEKNNLIVADSFYKDEILSITNGNNNLNYVDILDKKEVKTVISMEIQKGLYFNRLQEEEGKYLDKNIDRISENLISEYDAGIDLPKKIEEIFKETLKEKVREGRKEKNSLKERIDQVKDKAKETGEIKDQKKDKDIERT